MRTVGLQTHIWNNNLRSVVLLLSYPFMIMALVWAVVAVFGGVMGGTGAYSAGRDVSDIAMRTSVAFANHFILNNWHIIVGIVCVWFVIAYLFHAKMIRSLCKSHPVTRKEEPELYNLLENLCISRGITMPQFEIIESHARNAFASGITDKTYKITVTRGLLNSLQKDEIEGVLAHELTHIINRDVRLLIISVIFTGMIGFATQITWSHIRYNLFWGGRHRRRGNNGGDARVFIVLILVAAILWFGYLATMFTRFALSRRREFMADAGAVELTKNPQAMMRALMRISGKDKITTATDDIALMCIENSRPFLGMFATHPPIDKRIAALAKVTGEAIPEIRSGHRADDEERFKDPEGQNPQWVTKGRKTRKNPWIPSKSDN